MLLRYEQYVKEHSAFDNNYSEFLQWLSTSQEELKKHNQIVGDLNALQVLQQYLY